jgi:hypothetical protein
LVRCWRKIMSIVHTHANIGLKLPEIGEMVV